MTVLLGMGSGALAALLHLAATRSRAAAALGGGRILAIATLPFAVAAPALCIGVVIVWAPASAWAPVLGYWLARQAMLAWLERR